MDFDGMMKKADFLGQMDMQLDVLEGENEIEGWYFLNSRGNFFNTGASQQQASIKRVEVKQETLSLTAPTPFR